MLEKNLVRQTTQRCKDLFLEVHHSLRNGYISVEELVRENSYNKPGLFQHISLFPLRRSFSQVGKITALTNFPLHTSQTKALGLTRIGLETQHHH
jgi:hypothetical protein